MLRDWLIPTITRGWNSSDGVFFIVHAPRKLSQWFGRGTHGLYLFAWYERRII